MRKLPCWAVACCLLSLAAHLQPARTAEPRPVPYTSRIWQTDDGLPQNSVYAIAQTREGYLWVGTHQGLARFDGVRFCLLPPSAPVGLRHGPITALCASHDGGLWIGSESNGVTCLKAGVFTTFTEATGLPSNQARCLLEGRDGAIWIGTEGGVTRYQDGTLRNYTQKHGLGDPSVRALCEDRQGVLHIATKQGLSRLSRDGEIRTLNFGSGWINNALRRVMEDRQGNLWVGATEGLTRLRSEARAFYGLAEGLPHKTINALCEDRDGQIWVGTYGGLVRVVDGKISRLESDPVYGDLVYTVFEDREANLWVGARDGLYRLSPARFTTYTTQQGLAGNNVMSVCEDRAGTLWLATWDGGLSALRGDRVSVYTRTNGLTSDSALALHEGRDGSLWIGMEFNGGGLNRFRGACQNTFPKQAGLLNAAVRVIHEDRQGSLWVGTSAGLSVGQEDHWKTYAATNGLPGDVVLAILEDHAGDVWLGLEGGLSCYHQGQFTHYTTHDGLSHNAVGALYEDREQTLWIGTRGGGLNRFKQGRFSACTTQQGLFSDEIYELLEDDAGYFWMSCRQGIFRVARRELERCLQGEAPRVTCTVFGKSDGILSVQCNGVAKPSGWKSRDGRLWFPTIRGVVAVESRLKTNEQPPPVIIEEVIADRAIVRPASGDAVSVQALPPGKGEPGLRIPPGRGELEVHFTALSLQAPEKNRFRYWLEGVDSGWVEAGGLRVARYNNVVPGAYRFHVTACNNDGVWSQNGAILSVVLLPHFWQTWWFKIALASAVSLVLVALYRLRVARLRALENLRIQIAANLHDDVGARLTKVAMVTEFVERQTREDDQVKTHVRTLAATVREIIQAMDEIVWTINPQNDTLDNLANYIFQYAQDYFQNTGVRCRLDLPAQLPDRAISTEARHNLFMAVKEALNNVLKHARAHEVRIGLAVAESRVALSIADDGSGFEPEQADPSGNGLKNMKQRLHEIGGQLAIESRLGQGTVIKMEAEVG